MHIFQVEFLQADELPNYFVYMVVFEIKLVVSKVECTSYLNYSGARLPMLYLPVPIHGESFKSWPTYRLTKSTDKNRDDCLETCADYCKFRLICITPLDGDRLFFLQIISRRDVLCKLSKQAMNYNLSALVSLWWSLC